MARTPGQRGAFGAWLQGKRVARYPTQAKALEAYRKNAGLLIAPSEYAQWESGSRVPKADNPKMLALFEFYGSRPDMDTSGGSDTTVKPSDVSALIERLDAQERALTRLASAMERLVIPLGDPDVLRSVVRAFEEADTRPPLRPLDPPPIEEAPRAVRPRG